MYIIADYVITFPQLLTKWKLLLIQYQLALWTLVLLSR